MKVAALLFPLCFLGCATTTTRLTAPPSPMPDDIGGWHAPVRVDLPDPLPALPSARPRSPHEKVCDYTPGHECAAEVAVGSTLTIILNADERIDAMSHGDRAALPPGEEQPPWDVKQSYHQQRVLVTVHTAGLRMGLAISTDQGRDYALSLRSVGKSRVRYVRWEYPSEVLPARAVRSPLPDPSSPQAYHIGYTYADASGRPLGSDRPTWTPRQTVDDGRKTFILLPRNVAVMDAPMVRFIGATGPELVNVRQVGSVLVLDGLFHQAELRVGAGDTAEVVRVIRGTPQTIQCPGHPECPAWPMSPMSTAAR